MPQIRRPRSEERRRPSANEGGVHRSVKQAAIMGIYFACGKYYYSNVGLNKCPI